jgi:hypothetical protein
MRSIELKIDVSDAAGLGQPMRTAATVFFPDRAPTESPVVCFAFPGGATGASIIRSTCLMNREGAKWDDIVSVVGFMWLVIT